MTGESRRAQLNFVWFAWQLHAKHSGYHQIVKYLTEAQIDSGHHLSRRALLIRDILIRWPLRWLTPYIVQRMGALTYTVDSLAVELDVMLTIPVRHQQVLHFIYGESSYRLSGLAPRILGSKLVCTYHLPPDMLASHAFHHTGHKHLRRLDAVIAVASNQISFLAQFLPRDRIFLVPHGIDTGFYRPTNPRTPDKDLCLFVGDHLRDLATLKSVIEILNVRRPQTRFVLVTPDRNSAQLSGTSNVTIENNLSDEQLLQRYQTSALHLQPMKDCTANNAILEAMACGLPTVATDVGGVRDYLDASCAVLVPPGDPDRMAAEVVRLLEDDARLRMMSDSSRAAAMRFDWPRIATALRQVYDNILSK